MAPCWTQDSVDSVSMPPRQQIFEHVRANGRAARADITRALQISAGSATTLTGDLITSDILREVHEIPREAGRGRPHVALEVVSKAAYVIGIKLSFKRHSAMLCDFAGNIIATATTDASDKRRSIDNLMAKITTLIERVTADGDHKIGGVGIGLPRIVDKDTGLAR